MYVCMYVCMYVRVYVYSRVQSAMRTQLFQGGELGDPWTNLGGEERRRRREKSGENGSLGTGTNLPLFLCVLCMYVCMYVCVCVRVCVIVGDYAEVDCAFPSTHPARDVFRGM